MGYRDSNYFAKVFKRIAGVTPTEYQIQVLKEAGETMETDMRGSGGCGRNDDTAHTVRLEKSHVSLQDRGGTGICVFLCGKSAGGLSDDPGCKYFAELVEERTNGRIRILVQLVGVLGSENKVIKQMQYGGIDFARVSLAQLAEYIPSLNVLQMPYLYTDSRPYVEGARQEIERMRFWRVSARMMSSVCPGTMPEPEIFIIP